MPRVTIPAELAIAVRPTGGKRDLAKLRKLLFTNWLSPFLRNRIKYVPRTSHTNALGNTEYMIESDLATKPKAAATMPPSGPAPPSGPPGMAEPIKR